MEGSSFYVFLSILCGVLEFLSIINWKVILKPWVSAAIDSNWNGLLEKVLLKFQIDPSRTSTPAQYVAE